jgi:3'-phosphoadenosine 5'-phosphosulfate sulfotransferase (PAPS reductase)/FAD synthetase
LLDRNPYRIEPPALISFSGGRTSGFLLAKILSAYGRTLPPDIVVTFCNTGKERNETLDFVQNCSDYWKVPIVWLEWIADEPGYQIVGHNSASRDGSPFRNMLRQPVKRRDGTFGRRPLPTMVASSCTTNLKTRLKWRYARHALGWTKFNNAIGFRKDEEHRYDSAVKYAETGETIICPMVEDNVTERDVMLFWWRNQQFDLQLKQYEGNCDLCFKKSAGKISRIMKDRPELARWWIDVEAEAAASDRTGAFRDDRPTYANMLDAVERQSEFDFGIFDDCTSCPSHGCTD